MELQIHRDTKHGFESRVTDAFGRTSMPMDALQIENLRKVRIAWLL